MSNYDDNPWRAPGDHRPDPVSGTPGEGAGDGPSDGAPGWGHAAGGDETRQQHVWAPPADDPTAQPLWAGPEPTPTASAGGGRRGSGLMRWVAVAAVSALIGGGVGAATAASDGDDDTAAGSRTTATAARSDQAPVQPTANNIRGVLDRVEPAVVTIQVETVRGGQGSGTGMVISSDGEILTNAHVVGGARIINVTLEGDTEPRTARLLGTDTTIDSALIKLDNASNLPTIEFGDSNAVQVGDGVVAIGNALGLPGGPSVTSGIVSAKDRSISDATASLDNLIQTDAAINPGNSGGPLADLSGRVIGMNTAVIRGAGGEFQNIGFAMAIEAITPALDDLRSGRATAPAYLGVSTVTLDDDIKERFDLTPDAGAVVDTVQQNSPADDAGLSRFDVITEFDGQEVETNDSLVRLVRSKRPGDRVSIVYFRGDERREAQVTLGARPS